MAKTNWQDPKTSEIRSTHISGLQEAVGKLEESIGLETVAGTDIPLTEVFISNDDRCRIYQAPEGKRNWLISPAPVVKKNGVIITDDFEIDYGGGAIIFNTPISESDILTADATYTKKIDDKQLEILSNKIDNLAGEGRTTQTVKGNADKIGNLSTLKTNAKSDLVNAVNEVKDELDEHKAEDVAQGDVPHKGLGGSISHLTSTGEVTTPHTRQVNASLNSTASGIRSQVNASNNSIASGINSFVTASSSSSVNSDQAGIIACGDWNFTTSRGCKASANRSLVLASQGVENSIVSSIAGGNGATEPSTTNRKWHIFSTNGNIQHSGTISSGHSFTDFAELFPNLTGEKQEYGLLQTIDGFGVRPANEGERVIGVTSATAGIILGDTPFSWQGRWLKNEWGEYIYETIIDEVTGDKITQPKENPEWNPELEQQSRLQRPVEWTVVGLLGQVYVRLKEDVQPMDYVKAWQNGIGQKSLEPTNLQVMKITQEYDVEKGYKIGFCLLR